MSLLKFIMCMLLILSVVPVCLANTSSDNWFTATLDDEMDDLKNGAKLLLIAIVGLYLISCVICVIVGWKGNKKLFKIGIEGFGVLIIALVGYAFGIDFFEYYWNRYIQ